MDSKIYAGMMEAYKEVYAPKEDIAIEELIIELCNELNAFETLEEMAEFAVDVVESGTTLEFLFLLAEELEVDITEHLQELHEGKDPLSWAKSKAARMVINALSNTARKKALQTTTSAAVGKTGKVFRGAAVSPTVRAARDARGTVTAVTRAPGGPQAAANIRATVRNSARPQIPAGNPGPGEVVRANARRTAAQEKAARAAAGTRGTGTTNAYPGPEARNMTVDVPFTSRRTTGQLVRDFIGKNKGKLTTGAVGTTALGLTSSSVQRTAGTPPTTPSRDSVASVETPKAPETPKPQKTTKSARQIELDRINADKTLSDNEKWEKANRRLARVAAMRKAGASREEINKVLYNKGTKAYGAK